jgi:hypothetical protein
MFCQMQFFVVWDDSIFWCMQIEIFFWISRRKRWKSFENEDTKSLKLSFTSIKRSRMRKCEFSRRSHFIILKRWFKRASCSLFLMMLIQNSRLQRNDLINYINASSSNIFFSFYLKTTTFIIFFFIFHLSSFSFFSSVLFILFIIFYIADSVLSLTLRDNNAIIIIHFRFKINI